MKELIAFCGLDCEACDARRATITNDDTLRRETAEKWAAMNDSPQITPETIECMGCRTEGVKFGYCSMCGIRTCATGKGFETCGSCPEMDVCPTLAPILQHAPGARENLRG